MDWIDPKVHEKILAQGQESLTPGVAEYHRAVSRALVAAQRYRYYAPVKDAELENYHAAMDEYDAAWDALSQAAEAVARRVE